MAGCTLAGFDSLHGCNTNNHLKTRENEKGIINGRLNDKETKLQQISTLEAYKILQNLLCNMFGGGTIFEARGIYTHDDGSRVIENTLRCEVYDFCGDAAFDAKIFDFCQTVKRALNQESIAVEREIVTSELI